MIRLSLRQFRTQAIVAIGLLVVAAAVLIATRPHIAHLYRGLAQAQAACVASSKCEQTRVTLGTFDSLLELMGTVLVALPGLIGAFWGAPLISRELENGTHRLVWTQGVTRGRWLAVKLIVVGAASVAVTGLFSLLVTWWSSPIDSANMDRFSAGLFGERNVTPLGYAAFGFVLGVFVGVLLRRTLPAMATTLAVFLGVRLSFTYLIRQHLLSPLKVTKPLASVVEGFGQSNAGPPGLFTGGDVPNAWIYSARVLDSQGHSLHSQAVTNACPDLLQGLSPGPVAGGGHAVPAPAQARNLLTDCVTKLSSTFHAVVTYQPPSRYWPLQWYETGVYLAAALALAALCMYWVRHRVN